MDVIRKLDPDLIIGNKEENYEEGIDALSHDFPVWMSDINTLEASYAMIEEIGRMTHRQEQAALLINRIASLMPDTPPQPVASVLYLIWQEPYMAAGRNTFIDHLLNRAGFTNRVLGDRYPEIRLYYLTLPMN